MKTHTLKTKYGETVTIREMTKEEYRKFRAKMEAEQEKAQKESE